MQIPYFFTLAVFVPHLVMAGPVAATTSSDLLERASDLCPPSYMKVDAPCYPPPGTARLPSVCGGASVIVSQMQIIPCSETEGKDSLWLPSFLRNCMSLTLETAAVLEKHRRMDCIEAMCEGREVWLRQRPSCQVSKEVNRAADGSDGSGFPWTGPVCVTKKDTGPLVRVENTENRTTDGICVPSCRGAN